MALITRKSKAHILIGLAPTSLQAFNGNIQAGVNHLHSKLADFLPNFHVHVYTASSNRIEIQAFNAFLNFEIATYKDNQIHYPQLEERIKIFISSYFDSFSIDLLQEHPQAKANNPNSDDLCHFIIYWLSVINRINANLSSACRLSLHYSNKPDLVLKNHKNEVLFISSINIKEQELLDALHLISDVQNTAQQAGESSIKDDTPVKTNSYGAVDMKAVDDEIIQQDSNLIKYIEAKAAQLKKIDLNSHIESHLETIWQNFTLSYKQGAATKLTRLKLQIDF